MKASLDPYNISDDVFVSHIQQAARELTVSYTRQDQQGMGDGVADKPALQVIVLGSGGGPIESNTTAFLVRSTSTNWQRGSLLAVDAGVHLSAILKILETHPSDSRTPVKLLEGPFQGLELPYASTPANAAHITRSLVDTYLITHPHLDHISGFVVNTASLSGSRPKRLAALPSTIEAFKNHIFNNVIWPNLSDENNGAGLITYMRLMEGGSLAVGDGEGRGYIEVCEGLSVKTWSVSHGHCMENHSHQGSHRGGGSPSPSGTTFQLPLDSPRIPSQRSQRKSSTTSDLLRTESFPREKFCVYDSSAYFVRDISTGHEVLIFGDVEPDSISLSPRNRQVWSDAAPKIVEKKLRGIFIECSYADDQPEETLFGHLAPRYLIEELKVLVNEIQSFKTKEKEKESKKRKRISNGAAGLVEGNGTRRRSTRTSIDVPVTPLSRTKILTPTFEGQKLDEMREEPLSPHSGLPVRGQVPSPLEGVRVFIIHVKDKFNDGPHISETILRELQDYEEEARLGCEFVIAKAGQAVYL